MINGERRLNGIKNRKRKKKLKNKIPGLFENEEFEEDDDEDELDERTDINEVDLNGKQLNNFPIFMYHKYFLALFKWLCI